MKRFLIFVLLCCPLPALAYSGGMEKAIVHSMRKVSCMDAPRLPSPQMNPMSGYFAPPSDPAPAPGGDCVEYELRTDKVTYTIRPRHPILLLVGASVAIKLAVNELVVRAPDAAKDIRCSVVAMSLRSETEKAERRDRSHPPAVRCFESGREILCPN